MASMVQTNSLKCSLCGATLKATADAGRFVCPSCGSEVSAGNKSQSFAPVVEAVSKVQGGTDKTAAELAINRLEKELYSVQLLRERINSDYDAHHLNQNVKAITGGILSAVVMTMAGFGLAFWQANQMFTAYGFLAGLILGGVIYFLMNRNGRRLALEAREPIKRELQNCDRQIFQLKKKIAENRAIANS